MSAAQIAALQEQIAALSAQVSSIAAADSQGPVEPGRFVKFDMEKRLVYAEIYLPDVPDAHGHQMTAEEIEKMAHGFMKNARTNRIDVNHDNNTDYGCYMVESFIARSSDPDYAPGSWVGVVYVGDDKVWDGIKSGDITGFSFEGRGYLVEETI